MVLEQRRPGLQSCLLHGRINLGLLGPLAAGGGRRAHKSVSRGPRNGTHAAVTWKEVPRSPGQVYTQRPPRRPPPGSRPRWAEGAGSVCTGCFEIKFSAPGSQPSLGAKTFRCWPDVGLSDSPRSAPEAKPRERPPEKTHCGDKATPASSLSAMGPRSGRTQTGDRLSRSQGRLVSNKDFAAV